MQHWYMMGLKWQDARDTASRRLLPPRPNGMVSHHVRHWSAVTEPNPYDALIQVVTWACRQRGSTAHLASEDTEYGVSPPHDPGVNPGILPDMARTLGPTGSRRTTLDAQCRGSMPFYRLPRLVGEGHCRRLASEDTKYGKNPIPPGGRQ